MTASKSAWSEGMTNLSPSNSAPTPNQGIEAQLQRGNPSPARRPGIQHVFSAQHLDDVSHYHGGGHDSKYQDNDTGTEYSDEHEQVTNEDYDEAASKGEDEIPEVRMGIPDARDLEENLEKKPTTRSIKDPNLVCVIDRKRVQTRQHG